MLRPRLFLWLIAAYGLSLAGGCCCAPCLRMPCIESLDRHYPGSDDCMNGGPCGDPEDVGGMQTGMANCETCATQRQLTGGGGCSSCGTGCGGWFPWTRGFTGGGCGRFYWDEWWSDPPCKCEPCDLNGNYCGGGGICRAWRLGLPMPMMNRGGCGYGPGQCGGSSLSCWAKNRKCWDGCLFSCRTPCGSCGTGNCSTGTCGGGSCHIDSIGHNAAPHAGCKTCQSGGGQVITTEPVPAPAPVPAQPEAAPQNQPPSKGETTRMMPQARPVAGGYRPHAKTASSMGKYAPAKMASTRR